MSDELNSDNLEVNLPLNLVEATEVELDYLYGVLLDGYKKAVEDAAPGEIVETVQNHPDLIMMKTITRIKEERKAKADLKNKLVVFPRRIESGRANAIIGMIYEIITLLRTLGESLPLEDRETIMTELEKIVSEDTDLKEAIKDLYKALAGDFSDNVPEF